MSNVSAFMQKLPAGIDAAVITGEYSRRYLLDFRSSAGTLIATREKSYLIIDSRYYENASKTIQGAEVILQDKLYEQMQEVLDRHGAKQIAVESEVCSVRQLVTLRERLTGVTFLEDSRVSDLINQQRQIKTPEELAHIKAAQKVTDATFQHILGFIKSGKTEREIALEMEFFGRSQGAEGVSFTFIVASGPNSSMPHAMPTDRPVQAGDFITMDFGYLSNGYCSDMTRTVAVGHVSDKQREVYNLVLEAQLAALAAIKAGIPCNKIDAVARDIIDATPYKGCFGHGLGHSLGLEIHEPPRFNTECEVITQPGMILSVEPGIYLSGEFGVRIEDIMMITETGCENLTASPKELILL